MAQSRASFVAKLSIVLEETDESAFWLEFIIDEKLMTKRKSSLNLYSKEVSMNYHPFSSQQEETAQRRKQSTIEKFEAH